MNHVNSKVLIGLATFSMLAIVASMWLSSSRQPQSRDEAADFAFGGLRDRINEVRSLTVIGAENSTLVTLNNGDRGWTVREKSGFPADTGKLRELLLKLADARLLEAKTANQQKYGDLGVTAIEQKDAKGLLIRLEGLKNPLQLIVGNISGHGHGTFVRRPEDKQSWLAQGQISVEKNPAQWLNYALTDIGAERIAEIRIRKNQGGGLHLVKQTNKDVNFQVVDLPKGREVAESETLNALASTLSGLTLEDVAVSLSTLVPTVKAVYRTFDGMLIEIEAWPQDGKHYARFSASLDSASAERAIQAEIDRAKSDYEALLKAAKDSVAKKEGTKIEAAKIPAKPDAVADAAKYRQTRLDAVNAEIASLKQRFDHWQFLIPSYKYANIDKSIEDALKPKARK